MATKKKTRAKTVSKRLLKSAPKTTATAKAKLKSKSGPAKKAPAKKAPSAKASAMKARKAPETLRLKSFTPSITVNDLTKSLAFYTDGLGFIAAQRWEGEDGVLRGVMLNAGSAEFGISQDDWKMGTDRKKGVGLRLYLDTAQDVDAIAARAKAAGLSLIAEPSDDRQWGVRSFSIDDPDGFHLTITRDL